MVKGVIDTAFYNGQRARSLQFTNFSNKVKLSLPTNSELEIGLSSEMDSFINYPKTKSYMYICQVEFQIIDP